VTDAHAGPAGGDGRDGARFGADATIHFVNPLWDPNGGADLRTLATWALLRERVPSRLWSEYDPAPSIRAAYPVHRIRPLGLAMPRRGTAVFVGVYFRIGHWVRLASFRRIVLVYNTDQPDRLRKARARLAGTGTPIEVVATSPALCRRLGARMRVLESPVDVARFAGIVRDPARPFTVGRLSRDIRTKHHEDDPALWRGLAQRGIRVRIMGGTCLASELAGVPNVELLPAGAEDARAFLASLDAFVYRTSDRWFESFGRVVFEAMASGLPVIVGERGGYADYVEPHRNGWCVRDTAEAIDRVLRVAADREGAGAIGRIARLGTAALMRSIEGRTVDFLLPRARPDHAASALAPPASALAP